MPTQKHEPMGLGNGYPPLPPPPSERLCSTCRWRHPSRGLTGQPNGHFCDAPETKHRVAPVPATELVTGVIGEETMKQRFVTLFDHRSAGWWKTRFMDLCGREGRWWERS